MSCLAVGPSPASSSHHYKCGVTDTGEASNSTTRLEPQEILSDADGGVAEESVGSMDEAPVKTAHPDLSQDGHFESMVHLLEKWPIMIVKQLSLSVEHHR